MTRDGATSRVMAGVTEDGSSRVVAADAFLESWIEDGVFEEAQVALGPPPTPQVLVEYANIESLIAWLWCAPGVTAVQVEGRVEPPPEPGCCDPEAIGPAVVP